MNWQIYGLTDDGLAFCRVAGQPVGMVVLISRQIGAREIMSSYVLALAAEKIAACEEEAVGEAKGGAARDYATGIRFRFG